MVVIGLDFGTTYSCVGVWRNNVVEIIANDQGNRTNPSLVAFNDQEQLAGEAAKSQIGINPENTVYDLKTLLGHKFSDPEIQAKIASWPFKVVQGKDDQLLVEVTLKKKKQKYSAEDLAAMYLKEMVGMARNYVGKEIDHAVICIPNDFNAAQQQALAAAAKKIKLSVLRTIQEPSAAAIAYGLDDPKGEGQGTKNAVVLDFGGGNCDVTLLTSQDGLLSIRGHVAEKGLGGKQIDERLVKHFVSVFERKTKITIKGETGRAMAKLSYVCQNAKVRLSSVPQASVECDSLFEGKDMYESISRARFESLMTDLFVRCVDTVKKALEASKMDKSEIDQVILVGGVTRTPKLRQLLTDYLGDVRLVESINPNEVLAEGATLQASLLEAQVSQTPTTPVIQSSSLSLGLAVAGGLTAPVIPRNTPLPCSRTLTTSTGADNQTSVQVQVIQGECLKVADNTPVAKFALSGIAKAARGVPKIEVTFALSATGELTVSAEDKASSKSNKLTVTRVDANKGDECTKQIEKAEKQSAADKKLFARVAQFGDLRAHVEATAAQIKAKTLADESGAIAKACASFASWAAKEDIPTTSDILIKRTEFDAVCLQAEESEEESEDEGDESEEESEDEELD